MNAANRVLKTRKVDTNNDGEKVGMKVLEGYFDNLAASAINEKSVLDQLVANNAKIAATNEELVVIVKNVPTRLRISNKMPRCLLFS